MPHHRLEIAHTHLQRRTACWTNQQWRPAFCWSGTRMVSCIPLSSSSNCIHWTETHTTRRHVKYTKDAYKNMPQIELQIQGKSIIFLVNSGATHSVINPILQSGVTIKEYFSVHLQCVDPKSPSVKHALSSHCPTWRDLSEVPYTPGLVLYVDDLASRDPVIFCCVWS